MRRGGGGRAAAPARKPAPAACALRAAQLRGALPAHPTLSPTFSHPQPTATQLAGQYETRRRTGVAEPVPREIEAYLLPSCPTADRLLSAARGAAQQQVEAALPGGAGLAPGQLLLCLVHRKVRGRCHLGLLRLGGACSLAR